MGGYLRIALVGTCSCFLAAPLAAQTAAERKLLTQPPTSETITERSSNERPAFETRNELRRLLSQQYPSSLPTVLRLDPSLLTNQEYLATYPALAEFLARHPEVAHNPGFFVGVTRDAPAVEGVFVGLWFLLGFSLVVSLAAWGLKMFIEHRRWLRMINIQTNAHSKLLDRLTSNEDLLAYIQSPAGRQFLEAAPFSSQPRPEAAGAPVNRILWSVQAGVILGLAGAGLWISRAFVNEPVAQPLSVLGILASFVGVGFVISALVAYALSRMLGLFGQAPVHPHA